MIFGSKPENLFSMFQGFFSNNCSPSPPFEDKVIYKDAILLKSCARLLARASSVSTLRVKWVSSMQFGPLLYSSILRSNHSFAHWTELFLVVANMELWQVLNSLVQKFKLLIYFASFREISTKFWILHSLFSLRCKPKKMRLVQNFP